MRILATVIDIIIFSHEVSTCTRANQGAECYRGGISNVLRRYIPSQTTSLNSSRRGAQCRNAIHDSKARVLFAQDRSEQGTYTKINFIFLNGY